MELTPEELRRVTDALKSLQAGPRMMDEDTGELATQLVTSHELFRQVATMTVSAAYNCGYIKPGDRPDEETGPKIKSLNVSYLQMLTIGLKIGISLGEKRYQIFDDIMQRRAET